MKSVKFVLILAAWLVGSDARALSGPRPGLPPRYQAPSVLSVPWQFHAFAQHGAGCDRETESVQVVFEVGEDGWVRSVKAGGGVPPSAGLSRLLEKAAQARFSPKIVEWERVPSTVVLALPLPRTPCAGPLPVPEGPYLRTWQEPVDNP